MKLLCNSNKCPLISTTNCWTHGRLLSPAVVKKNMLKINLRVCNLSRLSDHTAVFLISLSVSLWALTQLFFFFFLASCSFMLPILEWLVVLVRLEMLSDEFWRSMVGSGYQESWEWLKYHKGSFLKFQIILLNPSCLYHWVSGQGCWEPPGWSPGPLHFWSWEYQWCPSDPSARNPVEGETSAGILDIHIRLQAGNWTMTLLMWGFWNVC